MYSNIAIFMILLSLSNIIGFFWYLVFSSHNKNNFILMIEKIFIIIFSIASMYFIMFLK